MTSSRYVKSQNIPFFFIQSFELQGLLGPQIFSGDNADPSISPGLLFRGPFDTEAE